LDSINAVDDEIYRLKTGEHVWRRRIKLDCPRKHTIIDLMEEQA
jgi:hypothetical protein